MNKKGDVPIVILVIGIILICCTAILSFFISSIKIRNSFIGIELTEELNSKIEEKIFNGEDPSGLYLEKKINKGILFWTKETLLFSVEYKFKP